MKLPARLASRLDQAALRRASTRSEIVRKALEAELQERPQPQTVLALAADLVGAFSGPRDLATNPRYRRGYGR